MFEICAGFDLHLITKNCKTVLQLAKKEFAYEFRMSHLLRKKLQEHELGLFQLAELLCANILISRHNKTLGMSLSKQKT